MTTASHNGRHTLVGETTSSTSEKKSWTKNRLLTIGGGAVLATTLVAGGIAIGTNTSGNESSSSVENPNNGSNPNTVIDGDVLMDTGGNYLSEEEMASRNTLLDICENGPDAADVEYFWDLEDWPITFNKVLEESLDGKAETPASPEKPSIVKLFPEGIKYIAENAETCADVVSVLQYAGSLDEVSQALQDRKDTGNELPDFTYLHKISMPLKDAE